VVLLIGGPDSRFRPMHRNRADTQPLTPVGRDNSPLLSLPQRFAVGRPHGGPTHSASINFAWLARSASTIGLEAACSCGGRCPQAKKLQHFFQNVHFWTDALTCMRFSAGVFSIGVSAPKYYSERGKSYWPGRAGLFC
jgi:hypothetical protein